MHCGGEKAGCRGSVTICWMKEGLQSCFKTCSVLSFCPAQRKTPLNAVLFEIDLSLLIILVASASINNKLSLMYLSIFVIYVCSCLKMYHPAHNLR